MSLYDIKPCAGLVFSHPYESDYSLVRQLHLANRTIPEAEFNSIMKNFAPEEDTLVGRTRKLRGAVGLYSDEESRGTPRQCPVCAYRFVHCQVYEYRWLEKCPIHGVPFTSRCPSCHNLWPTIKQLPSRNCRTCGLSSILDLDSDQIGLSKPEIKALDKFHENFALPHDCAPASVSFSNNSDEWFKSIHMNSPIFPSVSGTLNQRQSESHPPSLDVEILPMQGYSFDTACIRSRAPIGATKRFRGSKHRHLDCKTRAELSVLSDIRSLLPKEHGLHIANHKHVLIDNYLGLPNICVICHAASLWYYHIHHLKRHEDHKIGLQAYPIYGDLGYEPRIGELENFRIEAGGQDYEISPSFERWFYRAVFHQMFLEYLVVSQLILDLQQARSNKLGNCCDLVPNTYHSSQVCQNLAAFVEDGKRVTVIIEEGSFTTRAWFEQLSQRALQQIERSDGCCEYHDKFLEAHVDSEALWFCFDQPTITRKQYDSLSRSFIARPANREFRCARGSSPLCI